MTKNSQPHKKSLDKYNIYVIIYLEKIKAIKIKNFLKERGNKK